jgi:hypothetical protein
MRRFKFFSKILSLCLPLLFFVGCGGNNTGQLKMSLTDAATDQFLAVYVTIDEVQVHQEGAAEDSFQTVASPQKTFNLLDLVNGVREELGLATLNAGHYTQMRLIIGKTPDNGINILSQSHPFANYVIENDGSNTIHELKVPSGFQTGVKIVGGFDINEGQTTELILDFDASASVVVAGNSGQFLLKPTIKILLVTDFALVSGKVTEADGTTPIPGALVSAQISDPLATPPENQVVIEASTITDASGAYILFVRPGTYNIVAEKEGFSPSLIPDLVLMAGDNIPNQDLVLTASTTGHITGTVDIAGASSETFVTLSFRTTIAPVIEVLSLNVANGTGFDVVLPTGTYTVVASTFGKTTLVFTPVNIGDNLIITF